MQPEQSHAVDDAADDEPTEDAVDGLAPAAEEAGAADDGGGDRVEDELTAIRLVGAVLTVEERAEQDAGDARGDRGENEGPGADGGQFDTGSPCRPGGFGGGVEGGALTRPLG